MKPLITNIQRFCVHDGPGIRTTVFFKGCSIRCPWCANPENLSADEEYFYIKEKCSEDCAYSDICNAKKGGKITSEDMDRCVYNAIDKCGKYYGDEELYNELKKDAGFYKNNGGVTFSGGEALLFLPLYDKTVKRLRLDKISICVETSLMVPERNCIWAARNIDLFYVDLKLLDSAMCKSLLNGNLQLFMKNFKSLYGRVSKDRLIYRIPIVPDLTCIQKNFNKIKKLIADYPPSYVEIFSVHNLGAKKYERLGKEYTPYPQVDSKQLDEIKNDLMQTGVTVKINRI